MGLFVSTRNTDRQTDALTHTRSRRQPRQTRPIPHFKGSQPAGQQTPIRLLVVCVRARLMDGWIHVYVMDGWMDGQTDRKVVHSVTAVCAMD
mmetsp:Transcript_19509/g.55906  ORF Transcript_19509/g.55906 Transcript_19509/m.55906 type:complete len:92 (-) Transcript_19509:330-605(-)